jgi:serine/threonine protein kinase
MAQNPERLGRFRREAKTLAQRDHPNIVTIHSVEECDSIHFPTMQLVEGFPRQGWKLRRKKEPRHQYIRCGTVFREGVRHATSAAAFGQLGEREPGQKAVKEFPRSGRIS